ncbi:MAG: hypothetical protein QY323_02745 [Patescibacteria group bacterium]|nr:MAG: hypothetical protein QY323_02745 [Patescibacteria group bacterium]
MKDSQIELIGWYGAFAILLAYALASFGILETRGVPYQLLNLFGAFGIILVSIKKKAYQPAALNVVWLCIAAIALILAL